MNCKCLLCDFAIKTKLIQREDNCQISVPQNQRQVFQRFNFKEIREWLCCKFAVIKINSQYKIVLNYFTFWIFLKDCTCTLAKKILNIWSGVFHFKRPRFYLTISLRYEIEIIFLLQTYIDISPVVSTRFWPFHFVFQTGSRKQYIK